MFSQEQEFQTLLVEIQQGSEEAARRFLDVYGEHILRVIRSRLHRKLRPKFDSDDFLQDVLVSFFHDPPPPGAFQESKAFFKYLTRMAQNKVIDQVRGGLAQKRDFQRENSLQGSARVEALGVVGPDPTPSEQAVANEKWVNLVKDQPPKLQRALELLRQGHSHVEIARELDMNVKMVQRLVQKLRLRSTP